MSFTEAVISVFTNYANFKGRATRSEYWYFVLFNLIVCAVLTGLTKASSEFAILSMLYSLAAFIPGLAVVVRRLHDVGKSGWWYFIAFVPCVGFIILLLDLIKESQAGDNQYGPYPFE